VPGFVDGHAAAVWLATVGVPEPAPRASSGADAPRPSELAAVEREGAVWRGLVDVARRLRAASLPELAAELLLPVPELRPTLFQLGVRGCLVAVPVVVDGVAGPNPAAGT
jgi:hypothetical protein